MPACHANSVVSLLPSMLSSGATNDFATLLLKAVEGYNSATPVVNGIVEEIRQPVDASSAATKRKTHVGVCYELPYA
jgi:hypothetical protein